MKKRYALFFMVAAVLLMSFSVHAQELNNTNATQNTSIMTTPQFILPVQSTQQSKIDTLQQDVLTLKNNVQDLSDRTDENAVDIASTNEDVRRLRTSMNDKLVLYFSILAVAVIILFLLIIILFVTGHSLRKKEFRLEEEFNDGEFMQIKNYVQQYKEQTTKEQMQNYLMQQGKPLQKVTRAIAEVYGKR